MKKFWSLVIIFTLTLTLFAPIADAKRPSVPAPMPNLSSKTVAKKIKSGTYSYYGVKLRNTMGTLKKKWGNPTKKSLYRSTITIADYNYGPPGNLKVKAQASGKVSENSTKIDQIIISSNQHTKHEYKKVMKNFGPTKDIRSYGNTKMVTWHKGNTYTIINFKRVGSKWYAYSLSYSYTGRK